mgnify:CR=1 FL=1
MLVMPFDGEDDLVVVSHQDISKRKLAEEKLIGNNNELQKTNFELDRFVYSVSHDLRSPLTSVLGLLSFIEEDTNEPATASHAAMIRNSINRLDDYIKNILSYSRNNRMELKIEKIDLQKKTEEVINSLIHVKEAENITFKVDIDEKDQTLVRVVSDFINNECRPENENKVITQLETKNGIHLITTPFDKSQFNKAFQIDIQTDNPINLYIPDNNIPKFDE